jgi:tetratricopeptide (TPR) repeat protein
MSATEELLDKGLGHHQAGRLREAEQVYQEILRGNPQYANALHLLGLLQHQQGQHEVALKNIRRAISVLPRSELFWANLAAVYHALERYREAADGYEQAIRLNPNNGMAHFQLGCVLHALEDIDGAEANLRRAIQINPNSAQAHSHLGNTLVRLKKLDEAAGSLQHALKLSPGSAEVHTNLGLVLRHQGKLDEAVRSLQTALTIDSQYADAHKLLGLIFLLMGNFEAGWSHYEWRWRTKDRIFVPRNFPQPLWDGQPLEGRSLLVHAEQGLGDTLQFVRFAPLVQQRGCRVILECQKPLQTLLSSCRGIDQLVARGDALPPFDFHMPLLSLPCLLGTHAGNIPADVPYLVAREDLVRDWQGRLGDGNEFRVGICWQGSPTYRGDRQRSVALAYFAALADVRGVRLISLQKGAGTEQWVDVRFPVTILGADLDEANGAFMDTAAVMKNLDLVISSDTAVAHLAGALGVPVWVALPKLPDWRWLLDREDSPWYPTMRLFRQEKAGEWGPVFRRIAEALRDLIASRRQSSPAGGAPAPPSPALAGGLTIEVSPGELIDKITILEIKSERIADPAKLANVRREMAGLVTVRDRELAPLAELTALVAELKEVNEALWQIEDEIRDCERRRDFGPAFIALARSVYQQNDRRSDVKRRINDLFCSLIIEEKSYQSY